MAEEKTFETRLKKWLQSVGVYPAGHPEDKMTVKPVGWYFKVWGGGYQKSGIPDMILNVNGQFVAIELKAQHGRPSDLQKLNVNRIRGSDGSACFLYPSGYEQFKADFKTLMNGRMTGYKLQTVYR